MKVLITGANGFIGRNLVSMFGSMPDVEVLRVDRSSTASDLERALASATFVCHMAGVNRPIDDAEFVSGNTDLTQKLCDAARNAGRPIPIIFASSLHVERDNAYGKSKLAAEQALLRYSEATGAPVYIFRLPHVIGKWCRPNYNSVVATFCHNIARDLPIEIADPNYQLTLVHIDDLVATFLGIMRNGSTDAPYCHVTPSYPMTVGELADQLREFRASRETLMSDRVGTGRTRILFATYMSYVPPERFAYELKAHCDPRGMFVEMLKTRDSGQFSFFTAKPGITRGSHYHHAKAEKFLVVKGDARFRFRDILTGETRELCTSGARPTVVETVPGWAHDITNVGSDEMLVMLWANEVFDTARPDTYAAPL